MTERIDSKFWQSGVNSNLTRRQEADAKKAEYDRLKKLSEQKNDEAVQLYKVLSAIVENQNTALLSQIERLVQDLLIDRIRQSSQPNAEELAQTAAEKGFLVQHMFPLVTSGTTGEMRKAIPIVKKREKIAVKPGSPWIYYSTKHTFQIFIASLSKKAHLSDEMREALRGLGNDEINQVLLDATS